MKQAWETVVAFKLVWFRVLCYFLIPFLLGINEGFKDWDGDAWDMAHWFVKGKVFLVAFLLGLNSLIAFVDQSLSRAREVAKDIKDGTKDASKN